MSTHSTTWQQTILTYFTPKRESMLLAIDPDNLLRDDALLAAIQNSNYDVLELADEVAFRDAFERNYRGRWDVGEARHIVVVVHTTDAERHIPYDLWQKGRRVELSVANLFTHLNAIVVRELDNAYYADLYPAHQQLVARHEMQRGERQTIEFILRAVFGLDPLAAGDPARWVEFLIHKHYSARTLPPALEEYVAERLLPLAGVAGLRREFLTDGKAFYAWLGSQWVAYVASAAGAGTASAVDFSDPRLRPLLGYLFAEGLVARAPLPAGLPPEKAWMASGLAIGGLPAGPAIQDAKLGTVYTLKARLGRFCKLEEAGLPGGPTDLRDWLNLAPSGPRSSTRPTACPRRSTPRSRLTWRPLAPRWTAISGPSSRPATARLTTTATTVDRSAWRPSTAGSTAPSSPMPAWRWSVATACRWMPGGCWLNICAPPCPA